MARKPEKITIKSFLNPITLLTTLILLAGLILAGLAALFLGRSKEPPAEVTPVLTMISAPTLTPEPTQPPSTPTPSEPTVAVLPEGVIGVGIYVQVSGTDGAGLRMRSEPGLSGTVNFTALDAEAYDQTRNGWSAGDFLTPLAGE